MTSLSPPPASTSSDFRPRPMLTRRSSLPDLYSSAATRRRHHGHSISEVIDRPRKPHGKLCQIVLFAPQYLDQHIHELPYQQTEDEDDDDEDQANQDQDQPRPLHDDSDCCSVSEFESESEATNSGSGSGSGSGSDERKQPPPPNLEARLRMPQTHHDHLELPFFSNISHHHHRQSPHPHIHSHHLSKSPLPFASARSPSPNEPSPRSATPHQPAAPPSSPIPPEVDATTSQQQPQQQQRTEGDTGTKNSGFFQGEKKPFDFLRGENSKLAGVHVKELKERRKKLAKIRGERKMPIYLGCEEEALGVEILKKHRVTHVLNCGFGNRIENSTSKNNLFEYRHVCVPEISNALFHLFEEITTWMHTSLQNGAHLLVHSFDGSATSSSFVIAYLMRYENLSHLQALYTVLHAHPGVLPSAGIVQQLKMFEEHLHESKRSAHLMSSNICM